MPPTATDVSQLLNRIGFAAAQYVEGRASIADLFRPNKRCGVYVLRFATDQYYVGQALDVTRRYVQHATNHNDIREIRFKLVKRLQLNEVERDTIWKLESTGIPLRNISLTSIPAGESDFDLIMPAEQQTRWLADLDFADIGGTRPVDPVLRGKYQSRYQKFLRQPHSDEVIDVLRYYVRATIPAAKRGEISFWSCTCLPATPTVVPGGRTSPRINAYWQEVFAIFHVPDRLWYNWQVAKSPIQHYLGSLNRREQWFRRGVDFRNDLYPTGGSDQIRIVAKNSNAARMVLADAAFLQAMRLFNLRLMKKGACNNGRYHCMDLADRFYEA